jgi:hypothetical protein
MSWTYRLGVFVAALAILIPALAAQEKDKGKAKTEKKDNPSNLPTISGKLVNPGSEKGRIVVSVAESYVEISGRRPVTRQRHKNLEFGQADEVIVRTAIRPTFYENGKPRNPTQKELKEAKGEGNLPGYQSELSNLKRDQIVTVYYQVPKKTSGKKDDDALADSTPKARMIVIMKEP